MGNEAVEVDGIKVLSARLDGTDPKSMRDLVDRLKDKLGRSVVVIGSADGDKVRLAAGSQPGPDCLGFRQAIWLTSWHTRSEVREAGRPDFAQAGGSEPEKARCTGPAVGPGMG